MLPILQQLDAQSAPVPDTRPNLWGMQQNELEALCKEYGQPAFRGRQLLNSLFARRLTDFAEMTDLSKTFRAELAEKCSVALPAIDQKQVSEDGTRKYRFLTDDELAFEAVYIPSVAKSGKTNTLCVSSQTGCAVGCKFCYTASLRRNRNLSAAEIVGQVVQVMNDLHQDLGEAVGAKPVTNIVYMGMGEPLLNYDEVVQSIRVLLEPKGLDFSTRRITVSTSGIVPRIDSLGQDVGVQLAISLNASTDAVRTRIMPINKKWPIADLIAAMRRYPLKNRRRITIEYVLLKDINDSLDDAKRLVRLLEGIPVKINLLPLNPHDRTEFLPPTKARVDAFQKYLLEKHVNTIPRTARGQDISAACGQLGETVRPQGQASL